MSARRLLAGVAFASLAGFVLTFVLALHTERGRAADRTAFERLSGERLPSIQRLGDHTLGLIDVGTVAAGIALLVVVAVLRRQVGRAAAAAAAASLTIVTAELLKHGLPQLDGAIPTGRPATFPSGHTAVAVGLGLGVVLAVPPLLRPISAVVAAAYVAVVAYSVVVLGWHYPSDAIASFFIGGFWAAVVGLTLRTSRRPSLSFGGVALGMCAVAAALGVAAVVVARHNAAVASFRERPLLVAAAVAYGALSFLLYLVVTPLVAERER